MQKNLCFNMLINKISACSTQAVRRKDEEESY